MNALRISLTGVSLRNFNSHYFVEIAVISGFCCIFVGCYAQRGMAGASEWCPSELAVGDYMK